MEWSSQQDEALKKINAWLKDSSAPQVFRLFGYAGTGKTTLAKQIAQDVKGDVFFATFTGKAASVLRSKGCINASTIHSLIYHPKEKSRQELQKLEKQLQEEQEKILKEFPEIKREEIEIKHPLIKKIKDLISIERKNIARPVFSLNTTSPIASAGLVIIDECSMVDGIIGQDLLSFGTKILVQGDPAQLPPVKGEGFFMNSEPDFMLTEIHRQARDNPIIELATMVRNGKKLSRGNYGESKIIAKGTINPQECLDADQILVGRNKTRFSINKRMRTLLNYEGENPKIGEKIVCLKNDHDVGLLNGTIWYVSDVGEFSKDRIMLTIRPFEDMKGGEFLVEAHTHYFQNRSDDLHWSERKEAQEFDFGYALTTHKAQGSQWNNVIVFDESFSFRNDADKWLYTAITRAAEKLTIVET